jgi:hypothetical protein
MDQRVTTVSCRVVAMTWKTSACSSSCRQPLLKPQAASAITHPNGTRPAIARRTIALAMATFVSKAMLSPMPARRHRSRSSVHDGGR